MPRHPKNRELNDKEQKFLELYIENGDYKTAYVEAGYKFHAANARKKAEELQSHIKQAIYTRIGSHVPWAISELVLLATNSSSDTVRLNALKDILSRAGYDQAIQIETTEISEKDLDTKELSEEIRDLIKKAGPQLKAVGK
jgi:hypothetical protein